MVLPRRPARGSVIQFPSVASGEVQTSNIDAMPWSDVVVRTSFGRISVWLGRGSGIPLVFIHGNSVGKDVFRPLFFGALSTSCRMIALDLPGHGASDDAADPQRSYIVPGYAQAVVEVLDGLDVARVALVGWSLGGNVALEVAARFPGVLGVMLCGTPPVGTTPDAIAAGFRPHPDLHLWGRSHLTAAEHAAFARLMLGSKADARAQASIARTDGQARSFMVAHFRGGGVSDQRAFVEGTAIPVAIVNGADDPVVDVDYLRRLNYSSLWSRKVNLIRDGGHAPFLAQQESFDELLARFVRSMHRRHQRALANSNLSLSG